MFTIMSNQTKLELNQHQQQTQQNTSEVSKDMQMLFGFFNKNIVMLKNMYIQHRLSEGKGLLSLFLVTQPSHEVKVGYMKYNLLPPELKEDLNTRISNNTTDIIYFYFNTDSEAHLVETDIRNIGN